MTAEQGRPEAGHHTSKLCATCNVYHLDHDGDRIAALEADLAACRVARAEAQGTVEVLTEELHRVRPFIDDLSAFNGSLNVLANLPAAVAARMAQRERMETALRAAWAWHEMYCGHEESEAFMWYESMPDAMDAWEQAMAALGSGTGDGAQS
jgi:hypothetical protein